MSSRFNEFNYDKTRWELITEIDFDNSYSDDFGKITSFYLRNLSTNKKYSLSTDVRWRRVTSDNKCVLGLEQISDNKFIEYYHHHDYELREHYFDENGKHNSKKYCGSGFVALDDDKIWLKNWQIYSISKGCIIETLKPFEHTSTEMSLKTNSDGKNFLYCKRSLSYDDGTDYLLFVFDTETLSPALPAFSSLRDSFIKLSDDFTFSDLIEEEKKYKGYISSYMKSISKDSALKAEQTLLSGLVDKS